MATAYPFGYIKRSKPKLTVLRGYDSNEPTTRQIAYPVKNGGQTGGAESVTRRH